MTTLSSSSQDKSTRKTIVIKMSKQHNASNLNSNISSKQNVHQNHNDLRYTALHFDDSFRSKSFHDIYLTTEGLLVSPVTLVTKAFEVYMIHLS